jgi:hypothetical protein
MHSRLIARVTIEGALAAISVGLLALTLIAPDWIEELTGLEPDAGSGMLEWALVAILALMAVTLGGLAARDGWRLAHAGVTPAR